MFGFNFLPIITPPYNAQYTCYSIAMLPGNEREDVDRGGKIILPPSALDHLSRLNISYPMLFKLTNRKDKRMTHVGVLEFVAEEGNVYIPYWIMKFLLLDEGDVINVENADLPVATYSRFQPHCANFMDISNPKAVLENCLRSFACLTTGDVIAISYNNRVYELSVLETEPGPAVSIIECDMNVDFAPPVGSIEPVKEKDKEPMIDPASLMDEPSGFFAFKGEGNRLDGKQLKRDADQISPPQKRMYRRGIPDYDFNMGELNFIRNIPYPHNKEQDNRGALRGCLAAPLGAAAHTLGTSALKNEPSDKSEDFPGEGHTLKKRKE